MPGDKAGRPVGIVQALRLPPFVLYCNGLFCGKSKRTSEQLQALGYTNIKRYQIGMPV